MGKMCTGKWFFLVVLSVVCGTLRAADESQVFEFVRKYCVRCHNAKKTSGDLNLRALARAYVGDLEGCRDDLVEALRLNPKYQAALESLAWVHGQRDEPGAFRAIRKGRQVQNLEPQRRLHLDVLEALQWRTPAAAFELLDSAPAEQRDSWWWRLS